MCTISSPEQDTPHMSHWSRLSDDLVLALVSDVLHRCRPSTIGPRVRDIIALACVDSSTHALLQGNRSSGWPGTCVLAKVHSDFQLARLAYRHQASRFLSPWPWWGCGEIEYYVAFWSFDAPLQGTCPFLSLREKLRWIAQIRGVASFKRCRSEEEQRLKLLCCAVRELPPSFAREHQYVILKNVMRQVAALACDTTQPRLTFRARAA